jgi:hypothetical protein
MGRVSKDQQAKAFEGTPTNISDLNSIQKAVKGTIGDESLATKNLNTLASLARQDMFYPKRISGSPVDCAQFRSYPLPTFTITYEATKSGSSDDWDVDLAVQAIVNNYVGFDGRIDIEATVNLNQSFTQTISRYIKAKQTSLRRVSVNGTIDGTANFSFTNVQNGTTGGQEVDVNISMFYTPITSGIPAAVSPSGGGTAYYQPANVLTINNVGTSPAPYPYRWGTFFASSLSCSTHTTSGTEFTTYTENPTLSINDKLYQTNNGTIQGNGTYRLFAGGAQFFLVTVNNGFITSITTCNSGIGG